jgi:ribosomal protein S27E
VDERVWISDGDVVRCPDCGMPRVVFTISEEVVTLPVHCIKCDEGIFIVGAGHTTVMPRLVIDHATV